MMTLDDVRKLLRERVGSEYGDISAYAREHNISRSIVTDVLNRKREPTAQLLQTLGLRRITRYEPLRRR